MKVCGLGISIIRKPMEKSVSRNSKFDFSSLGVHEHSFWACTGLTHLHTCSGNEGVRIT